MEVIIFKKNEILTSSFKNQKLQTLVNFNSFSELKNECYGNFQDLDLTKCNIDLLDKNSEKNRRAAAKYLHEYELVKLICKKQVISRAYFKLYEMVYHENIISNTNLNCFFICEAPGGFIECVSDIRRKKNLRTNFISVSKYDQYIKYDRYLESTSLIYSDILVPDNLIETLQKVNKRFPNKLDFITADGGFDIKIFNGQEILSSKLLLCEIFLAISTQKIGGMFIIKFFDMFSHNSIIYYLILCSLYNYVKIIKPKTSRNCNSERYLICYHFKGDDSLTDIIWEIIQNFQINNENASIIFPDFNFENHSESIKKLKSFNNLIVFEQVKTINESLKMVNGKNQYFQNLLLGIFLEKRNTLTFKGILASRIKKCSEFLRNLNINTNDI